VAGDTSTWPDAYVGDGTAMNSADGDLSLDGLRVDEAKRVIGEWLSRNAAGEPTINYKLRDWLFSRQRYWGEPFPIVWKNGHHEALPESALPLLPPPLEDFKPTKEGQPPLARATRFSSSRRANGWSRSAAPWVAIAYWWWIESYVYRHRDGARPRRRRGANR